MTVPSQTPVSTHVGNGITTSFAYGFKLLDDDDITVSVDGVVKTLGVDYTVTGVGVDAGGNVVFGAAPASLAAIALVREVTIERLTDYQYSGDFQADTVNRDFDRVVMMLQDSGVSVANALRYPPGDPASGELPDVAGRALKGLAFDVNGEPVMTTAAGDANALEVALASNATSALGAGKIGYDAALAYAAGTSGKGIKDAAAAAATALADAATAQGTASAAAANINTFKADLLDATGVAGKGSLLTGYKLTADNSTGRLLQSKLDDVVSVQDFNVKPGNAAAVNSNGIINAVGFASSRGGCTLHFPRGVYDFNDTIDIGAVHNLRIVGDGPDATILRITHPSAHFLWAAGSTMYQCIENLSLTSTVPRTGGAMFFGGFWRRGLMQRVKITEHFYGVFLEGFEQSTLNEVFIVKPSGAGYSLVCGADGVPQAANLNINNCFFRGNNELINDAAVSLAGILVKNCEAIFGVNSDFGQYSGQAMRVAPSIRTANCHFVQCYFDGTSGGDNVLMDGAGIKQQFQFTGCWFNGAGQHAPGAVDCSGLNAAGAGEFFDINLTGCRFLSTSGPHVNLLTIHQDFNFSGCVFVNSGLNGSSTFRNSVYLSTPGTADTVKFPVFSGCKWQGTGGTYDVSANQYSTPAASYGPIFSGCFFGKGIQKDDTKYWGQVTGCVDPSNTGSTASASTMRISPAQNYMVVTGTASINTIPPTYAGHIVSFRPVAASTFVDDGGNLRLAGNFVSSTGIFLTLCCEANGEWREVSRTAS